MTTPASLAIFWFKRDLRLQDNAALALAAAQGPILPLYIAEPELWQQPDTAARQWEFVSETLQDLRADLAAAGQPLVVRVGEAVTVLETLRRAHGVTRMFSQQETGTGWTYARDRTVAAWARGSGVEWVELPQGGVIRGLQNRAGWSARRERFLTSPPLPAPALVPLAGPEPGVIPTARSLRLTEDPCRHRQQGGRSRGIALMESFLAGRHRGYRSGMAQPALAERVCSRLSPHLAVGAISAREVAAATAEADRNSDLLSFANRLRRRDLFLQRLEDAPELDHRPLHPAFASLLPTPLPTARTAWEAGETGLPFVDACLRYLNATGWLGFRPRGMLVSVGCHLLGLDWREVGGLLARRFTDYEPGIHWSEVQIHAGVTGIDALRIADPVRLGRMLDGAGSFTRRWLPELAAVPDALLHEPWRWEGARSLLGRRYPEPVTDPAVATRAARATFAQPRRQPGFAQVAEEISLRTPPARRPSGATVRRAARPPAPEGQLSFDF